MIMRFKIEVYNNGSTLWRYFESNCANLININNKLI